MAIFNPDKGYSAEITSFEKICAISWVLGTNLVKISEKIRGVIIGIVDKIANEMELPDDFVGKYKKIKEMNK